MSTKRWPGPVELVAGLVDERLVGAACSGAAPVFDDHVDGESTDDRAQRHATAIALCECCSVADACATAAGEHTAIGIWAGALHLERPTGKGRP